MGYSMGDPRPPKLNYSYVASHRTKAGSNIELTEETITNISSTKNFTPKLMETNNGENIIPYNNTHPWGVFFTILGTVLLDFDADACQSPARAFLLDVTLPGNHLIIYR